MDKKLKLVENVLFVSGVGLGLYTLIVTYFRNKSLPPGVCPMNNNRNLIYTAIALLLLSIVFPYVARFFLKFKDR